MTRILFSAVLLYCLAGSVCAQTAMHVDQFVDLTATAGGSQGSIAGSYVYNWKIGPKGKFEAGVGVRLTSYFGTKKDFLTAGPARLTRTFTTPFVIVFAGQREENFDTLTVQRPFTNSLNISANFGYNISERWYAGFNIDVIGFTVGRKGSGILASNGITRTEPSAKPSAFNLLLTGDHDRGTLNSEFFVAYAFAERWRVKAVYQFLFVEYETQMFKQVTDDGTAVSRFRNKANNFGLGVSFKLL